MIQKNLSIQNFDLELKDYRSADMRNGNLANSIQATAM
jgi:hypothetical protein